MRLFSAATQAASRGDEAWSTSSSGVSAFSWAEKYNMRRWEARGHCSFQWCWSSQSKTKDTSCPTLPFNHCLQSLRIISLSPLPSPLLEKKTSRETSSLDHRSPLLSIKQWAAHLELATPENEGRILKLTLCLCLSILTDANASSLLIGKQCFSALVLKTVLFLWPTLLIKFCEFQQPLRRQLLQKIDGKLFAFSKER